MLTLIRESYHEFKKVNTITCCAMFGALAIVLSYVASIRVTPNIKIGLGALPNEMVDYLFGPVVGALFGGGMDSANMPTTTLADDDFADGKIDILEVLVKTGITKSRGEGRRLVQQGGVSVDDNKVTDIALTFAQADLKANPIIVKKGKKVFHKVQA